MKPVVLVAQDEDKDKEIAKLQSMNDEHEKKAKAMHEEHEKMAAQIKAMDMPPEVPATPGPVVKAIFAQMDEEERKQARIEAETAVAQEKDEEKKAVMQKAMEDIFETGNGVNTNAQNKDEEEKTAVIAALTAKVAKPIINEILTAKTKAGATEEHIKEETKRLVAMTLPQVEAEYKSQEVFIKQSLSASEIAESNESLIASSEKGFEFNGVSPLTASAVDIDAALEAATQ